MATPEPVIAEVADAAETAPDTDDPELLRQRAASRRKAEEQARQLELEAAAKARAEEAARQAEEQAGQGAAKETDRKPKRLHAAPINVCN